MSLNPYSAEDLLERFNRRCRIAISVLIVIAALANVAAGIMLFRWWMAL